MRVRVDAGGTTFLAVCACGRWRGLALTHERALERASQHEREQHPEDVHARAALAMWRRRHPAPDTRTARVKDPRQSPAP